MHSGGSQNSKPAAMEQDERVRPIRILGLAISGSNCDQLPRNRRGQMDPLVGVWLRVTLVIHSLDSAIFAPDSRTSRAMQ